MKNLKLLFAITLFIIFAYRHSYTEETVHIFTDASGKETISRENRDVVSDTQNKELSPPLTNEERKKGESNSKAAEKGITTTGKTYKDPVTGMEFVFVKGGCYQMGDTFGDGDSDEKPVHEVCVDDFYIGKYEVTQKEWKEVMGSNPSYFKGCDNCPVEEVYWDDVQEYINKLNQKTGKKYRLSTEAEWEYAARSGGKNEKYVGSNDIDSVAWYHNNSGSKTHAVGKKLPNRLGIYDMSGNISEWVQDWYDENYYKNSPRNNPRGPDSGLNHVIRGGSWGYYPSDVRTAFRSFVAPGNSGGFFGFRLVRTD